MKYIARFWTKDNPMADKNTSSFRNTLRRMAAEADPAERARVADLFASQIELALDTQGGNMQVALWNVEEGVAKKIDHIHEQIGNNNTLQSAVLEAVNGLRVSFDQSAAETAARLGKNEQEIDSLKLSVGNLEERADRIDQHNKVRDDQIEALQRDSEATIRRISLVEVEITSLKHEHRRLLSHLKISTDELKRIGEEHGGAE